MRSGVDQQQASLRGSRTATIIRLEHGEATPAWHFLRTTTTLYEVLLSCRGEEGQGRRVEIGGKRAVTTVCTGKSVASCSPSDFVVFPPKPCKTRNIASHHLRSGLHSLPDIFIFSVVHDSIIPFNSAFSTRRSLPPLVYEFPSRPSYFPFPPRRCPATTNRPTICDLHQVTNSRHAIYHCIGASFLQLGIDVDPRFRH
jgi:hypothetical protein